MAIEERIVEPGKREHGIPRVEVHRSPEPHMMLVILFVFVFFAFVSMYLPSWARYLWWGVLLVVMMAVTSRIYHAIPRKGLVGLVVLVTVMVVLAALDYTGTI